MHHAYKVGTTRYFRPVFGIRLSGRGWEGTSHLVQHSPFWPDIPANCAAGHAPHAIAHGANRGELAPARLALAPVGMTTAPGPSPQIPVAAGTTARSFTLLDRMPLWPLRDHRADDAPTPLRPTTIDNRSITEPIIRNPVEHFREESVVPTVCRLQRMADTRS